MKKNNPSKLEHVKIKNGKATKNRWANNKDAMVKHIIGACHSEKAKAKRIKTLKTSVLWAKFQIKNKDPSTKLRGREHANYNHTIYNWININNGAKKSATKHDMQNYFGGYSSNWRKVITGEYKKTCGWALIK